MTPLLTLVLAWLFGLTAASILTQPTWMWLLLAGGGLLLLFGLRARQAFRWPLVCLIALALAGARYQFAQPTFDETTLAHYNDVGTVTLEGVVWDEPDERDTRTNLRVQVETLIVLGETPRTVSGVALVYAPSLSTARLAETGEPRWRYGDHVRVIGNLETPPEFESFSYRDYLARLGVYSQVRQAEVEFLAAEQGHGLYQPLFNFKAQALNTLEQLFPEPHAALLQGILLGVESRIPQTIKDQFSVTGTSHIVAISGFNIAILVGLFMALFSRWAGPNRGALLTIVVIALYTVLVGVSASVVRAAIMGSLGVIGQRLGRSGAGLNLLAVAAFGMTLFNPLTLWDVGFQLSAAATMGLILYGDALKTGLQSWLAKRLNAERAARLANFASDLFLLTLAAQITTLPILAYTFRQVSIISLVANIVILPVQPAVMILGGAALLLGLVWLPLGQVAAWLAYPFTAYTLAFVDVFARVPGASLALGEVAPALVLIFYAALFSWTWMSQKPVDARPSWWARLTQELVPAGGLAALSLVAFYAWGSFFTLPQSGQLRLTVLNVGEGEAVLVQTPSGQHALINGGPSGNVLVRGLAQNLPLFTSELNLLVAGAVQDENIGGLPDLLERYRVEQAALTQATRGGAAYPALSAALNSRRVPIYLAADLPTFNLGNGAQLKVLMDSERGSVVRVEWGRFSALLPLNLRDVSVAELPPSTALLLTRSTLRSLTAELVEAVNPTVIILSADTATRLTPEQSALLAGRTFLLTAEHGTVKLITDGTQLWAEGER